LTIISKVKLCGQPTPGGAIAFGTLIATANDANELNMRYQHVNHAEQLMTGRCTSIPEMLSDGRQRLHETWQWACGDHSIGHSLAEEVLSKA
jgi:hypothetical protein